MGKRRVQKTEQKKKKTSKLAYVALGLITVGGFLLRVLGQLDKVFVGDNVWFRGVDAWYHMRLADVTTAHFPHLLKWDMYALFPNGHEVGYLPMNAWIISFFGQFFNHEVVGAFLPPVFGALTLVSVYLIGRELFNSNIGLIASLLVAVLPGEFLHRTLLGFTDHHALEAFFMTTTLLFFLYSYRNGKLKWPLLTGISLGVYHLAWAGAPFFIIVLGIWTWFEFLRRFRKREDVYPLFKMVSIPVLVSLVISYPFLTGPAKLVSFGVLSVTLSLWLLTRYVKDRETILFALTILVPVGLTVVGFFHSWNDLLLTFFWKGGTTVQEVVPLDLHTIFSTYGIAFFMVIGGLWFCPRNRFTGLFLVWSVVLILISLGQRRWGYYTVVPVSLLASYFTYRIAQWMQPQVRAAVIIVIITFMLVPNVQGTIRLAQLPNNISADWYVTLTWLRKNTPEPFPRDAYYAVEIRGPESKPKYGVLSWWDYGHWIIRIGRRVPTDSPTLTSNRDARFLTAKTEEEALKEAEGIRYVVIDGTLLTGKWYAVARRGGAEGMDVKESELYRLWTNQSTHWKEIFEKGSIKVYERR